tara:strand:- start:262 stop:519 length:258 start_codon:yes stop_codon:yes gene_type:complete
MKRLDIITNEGYIKETLEQCKWSGFNTGQTASEIKKIIDEAVKLVSKNESLHLVSCSDNKYCEDCGDYVKDGCDNKQCNDYKSCN